MKALTICQPYAHLILTGEKPVENRTWRSDYHGLLLIHAGKSRSWLSDGDEDRYPLVFGAIVGRVLMRGSRRPERYIAEHPEHADSEHINGPWCFVLCQPERFATPIPYRGKQGFFDIPQTVFDMGAGPNKAECFICGGHGVLDGEEEPLMCTNCRGTGFTISECSVCSDTGWTEATDIYSHCPECTADSDSLGPESESTT